MYCKEHDSPPKPSQGRSQMERHQRHRDEKVPDKRCQQAVKLSGRQLEKSAG